MEAKEEPQAGRPLADRMRPQTLDEFIGQEDLLAPGNLCARRSSATI